MNIMNYHPDVIESEFYKLKTDLESKNNKNKRKFNKIATLLGIACVILLAIAILVPIFLLKDALTTNANIAGIVLTVVFAVAFAATLMIFIGCLVNGPDVSSFSYNETFAMQFWRLYTSANVLNIKQDDETKNCIIVTYENEHHFVRTKTMVTSGILMSTEIEEPILDVGRGYIVVPYQVEEKPKIINEYKGDITNVEGTN